MTTAAIYARKSTEQRVADEAKSVERQKENARAYAAAKGWTVLDEHVYVDDGISGAEFERRPGFAHMMSLLPAGAPFQMLVVSEQKSLGREMSETAYVIKQLALAGVETWSYLEDRCLTPRDTAGKLLSMVQGYADEDHRVKSAMRVHEAHLDRARKGYVSGGRVFGYRNKDVYSGVDASGRPLRSHVEHEIDEEEARVVRRIFDLYDAGRGMKRIVRQLAKEGAPPPKALRRRDGSLTRRGWLPSTVRAILRREIYRGVIVWNRWRKRNAWGQVDPSTRPEAEWVRTPAPHLRIVPEDLWLRVQGRLAEVEGRALRFESGRLSGRPTAAGAPMLLAGLATCGTCGGGLTLETSGGPRGGDAFDALPRPGDRPPRKRQFRYYVCFQAQVKHACPNTLRVPVADADEAVLRAVEDHALTPEAVEQVIRFSEQDDVDDQRERLEREARDVEKRMRRWFEAVEAGGDSAAALARIRELEARQRAIAQEVAALRPVPRLAPAVVEGRLARWRRLLRQSTDQGRAVLQRVLRGRIVFTPRADGAGYDFQCPTRFDKLFTGVVVDRPGWIRDGDVRGTGHIRPEDTPDADYGRLLEQAERRAEGPKKGIRTPKGLRPGAFKAPALPLG